MKTKDTVLVVDDEMDLCLLIRRILAREDIEVKCVFSLQDVGRQLAENPDIVILDNNLPDGLGIDYYRDHQPEFDGSHTIMISADASPSTRRQAETQGIERFLQKPFSKEHFLQVIREIRAA